MNQSFQKMQFLMTPAWQEHAEMVMHFCQFSQNLLLVLAPQSGGKTTFLKQVLNTHQKQGCEDYKLRTHMIQATPQTTVESLMKEVVKGFDLEWSDLSLVNQQIQANLEEDYLQQEITWALFVDDAHLLSNEQLQALLSLIKHDKETHKPLHLILLGEPSLELRLLAPEFIALVQGKMFTIELAPWSLQDLHTFFAQDTIKLSKEQISVIFERSRGLPGYVMREREAMLTHLIARKKMAKNHFKYWGMHPVSLGILVGIVLGGGYLFWNHGQEAEGAFVPVNALQPTQNNWPDKDKPAKKANSEVAFHFDKVDHSDILEEDMTIEQGGKAVPLANSEPTLEEPKVKVAPTDTNTPQMPAAESVEKKVINNEANSSHEKSLDEQAQHILSAKSDHYTLQLLGASKVESVNHFIQQHHLQNKTHFVRTKRAGKDWYIVVYGDYPSAQAAKAAAKVMPESLRQAKLEPWVREIHAVQEDIRQSHNG